MSEYSILDVGHKTTVVLTARRATPNSWQILGAGDSPTRGFLNGEISHIGDLVETLAEARRKCEKASGVAINRLYYNFDDSQIQSIRSKGHKYLKGEGEITSVDVKDAADAARRSADTFERATVYAKELSFVIDGRDPVWDPIGVFGAELEATLHLLQARSSLCQQWKSAIERAHISQGTLVPSAWSAAVAILPPSDRERVRLILDLGEDFFNFFTFEKSRITDACTLLACLDSNGTMDEGAAMLLKKITQENPNIEQVFVTGDLASQEKVIQKLESVTGLPVLQAPALGVSGVLSQPRFASAVGLLSVAEEIEKREPVMRKPRGFLDGVKTKATTFIHEYF